MTTKYTSSAGVSSDEPDDGLTRIGGHVICTQGLAAHVTSRGVARRLPVDREHVDVAKHFLQQCRRAVLSITCPISGALKHEIERWASRYVSPGAVIVAAIELGINIGPFHGHGPREDDELSPAFYEPPIAAVIGVNSLDVERIAGTC